MHVYIVQLVVWEIPGVKKGFLAEEGDGCLRLKTEGINLQVCENEVIAHFHYSITATCM